MVALNSYCCISLETGALIIAFLEILPSGLQLVYSIFFACVLDLNPVLWAYNVYCTITGCNEERFQCVVCCEPQILHLVFDSWNNRQRLDTICWILKLIHISFGFWLVRGIIKKRPLIVEHWMIFKTSWILVTIFSKIILACYKGQLLFANGIEFAGFYLNVCLIYVVVRFHEEMMNKLVHKVVHFEE